MDGALAPGGNRRENFGGEEVRTSRGSFCRIEELLPEKIALPFPGPELILNNLQLVYGIGPRTAAALRESGYDNLEKLVAHPKWGRRRRRFSAWWRGKNSGASRVTARGRGVDRVFFPPGNSLS